MQKDFPFVKLFQKAHVVQLIKTFSARKISLRRKFGLKCLNYSTIVLNSDSEFSQFVFIFRNLKSLKSEKSGFSSNVEAHNYKSEVSEEIFEYL